MTVLVFAKASSAGINSKTGITDRTSQNQSKECHSHKEHFPNKKAPTQLGAPGPRRLSLKKRCRTMTGRKPSGKQAMWKTAPALPQRRHLEDREGPVLVEAPKKQWRRQAQLRWLRQSSSPKIFAFRVFLRPRFYYPGLIALDNVKLLGSSEKPNSACMCGACCVCTSPASPRGP